MTTNQNNDSLPPTTISSLNPSLSLNTSLSSTPIQHKKALANIETTTSEERSTSQKPQPRILLDESDDSFSWIPQQPITSTTTFSNQSTFLNRNSPHSSPSSKLNPPKLLAYQKQKSQNNVVTSSSTYQHTSILNTTLSNDISARINEKVVASNYNSTTMTSNNNENTNHNTTKPRSPTSKEKRRKIKSAPASVKRNGISTVDGDRNSTRGIFSAIKELLTMCKGRSNHIQPNNNYTSMIEANETLNFANEQTLQQDKQQPQNDQRNTIPQQQVPPHHQHGTESSSSGCFHRTESNHSGDSSVVQLQTCDFSLNPSEKQQTEKTEVEVFDSPSKINNRKARCGAHASSSDFIRSSAQPVPLYFFVLNGQQQQQQQQQHGSSPKKAQAENFIFDISPASTSGTNENLE
ncbi:hypothetical protein FDP41_007100 [Naegleria fowleri]|uniref:Uncharacterized protein n=1 Tax=Naegleria fowleri TaxID=5763 RepID=A0A6A5B4J6_NAEFO|nr:uncharacterized protein FDP41_007100 [Naegleria fowleri]KAF0973713.1 hypothetical protein FDP41_007100 [Naegleria fowleri]